MPTTKRNRERGVTIRHSRTCPSRAGGECDAETKKKSRCRPTYEARVYDKNALNHKRVCASRSGGRCDCSPTRGKQISRTFTKLSEARGWRPLGIADVKRGDLRASTGTTVREAAEELRAAVLNGTLRQKGGRHYKPSSLRSIEVNLRLFVIPRLGHMKLTDVRRQEMQVFADELLAEGRTPGKVDKAVMAARVLFRRELRRGRVTENPTRDLDLPSADGRRDRAASVEEAAELLAALPKEVRPLWATAFYAGLRLGELRALRWEDVDLGSGVIHVRHGWDAKEGEIPPKSKKGERRVPVAAALRDHLDELKATTDRGGADFVFGSAADRVFSPNWERQKARRAWATANERRAKNDRQLLVPIGLHECRHTCVSLWAAAGVPLERIGDYVGHSTTYMVDRYRHLVEGQFERDVELIDDFFARADTAARLAQLDEAVLTEDALPS